MKPPYTPRQGQFLAHTNHHTTTKNPLDDSEFVPLLDMFIASFTQAGLSAASIQQLRRHACEVYDHYCQQAAPETTFKENLELMFSYLPPALLSRWQESVA